MDHRQRYFREVPDMSRTKPFLIGLLFGAGLSFVALRYHVVRYTDGYMLVPRTEQPPIRSAYADIRDWGAGMWKQYPEVAAALVKDGHGKLVADSVTGDLLGKIDPADDGTFDLTPDPTPPTPTRPASSVRKAPPSPIRLQPTSSDKIAPPRPARLSQPTDADRTVSQGKPTEAGTTNSETQVRSALDALFAPYDAAASKPMEKSTQSSIPTSAAAPSGRILDLKDLDVDLGPAIQILPSSSIPKQAGALFSPRKVIEPTPTLATSPVSQTASASDTKSGGESHQFPLK